MEMADVIAQTPYENLAVACGGAGKSIGMKSVRMARLADLVQAAREEFDVVILDTPPCSLLADASEYAALADCGLMVVRQEYTGRDQILDGVQRLGDADLPLIGMVMNHVRGKHGNGYGYGSKNKKRSYGFDYIRTKFSKKPVDSPYQYIEDDED
jgi:Mrp family chromosome partitioning ATPase